MLQPQKRDHRAREERRAAHWVPGRECIRPGHQDRAVWREKSYIVKKSHADRNDRPYTVRDDGEILAVPLKTALRPRRPPRQSRLAHALDIRGREGAYTTPSHHWHRYRKLVTG